MSLSRCKATDVSARGSLGRNLSQSGLQQDFTRHVTG
jgi:hypothetical protein